MTKSRNSIEVVKVEIVVVVEVGVKVASGKVVENLEVVEEAEWRETRMVNSRDTIGRHVGTKEGQAEK